MRLRDGSRHETVAGQPQQYNISTFDFTDLPLASEPAKRSASGTHGHGHLRHAHERAAAAQPRARRQALPDRDAQALRLSGGLPGADAGGRSAGRHLAARRQELRLVFTILLVFVYYLLSSTGIALGKQNWISAFFAVWSANLLFAAGGLFLLWQMASRRPRSECDRLPGPRACQSPEAAVPTSHRRPARAACSAGFNRVPSARKARNVFPRILDEYVVREFLGIFLLVLAGFVMLMLVFTFFELIGDILRNHIALSTVGEYLVNLTPSMLYQITPLAVLIAVLVTFGVLNRNSEIIAMKATGISLYRLVIPIVSIAAMLAVGLFLFDQFYLPQANRRQEALRNIIKGRPPQTVLHPEQNWIFGQPRPGEPGRIFYYQFFDPGSQRVRQSLHLRVRSLHLRALAAHLRRPRRLGCRRPARGSS